MKRRFQKIAALMLVGAMAGTLVTGCGGSSSGSSSESSSDSKEASDSSSSNSNGAAEVTLWHYFEHEAPDLEAVAEKYNESQDKIHVTCTYVSREELMTSTQSVQYQESFLTSEWLIHRIWNPIFLLVYLRTSQMTSKIGMN